MFNLTSSKINFIHIYIYLETFSFKDNISIEEKNVSQENSSHRVKKNIFCKKKALNYGRQGLGRVPTTEKMHQ